MKIIRLLLSMSIAITAYGNEEWSMDEKIKAGWEYAMQIECSGLAFNAEEYEVSEMHDKKAKMMFEDIISTGGMDSSDLSGYKIRALGINDGIEKTLRIYNKNHPYQYQKIYVMSECNQ